jgi:tetratricopeptide (TPR) repeat protein
MYTINIYLKFALIALFLIGGTVLAFTAGFWYALPLILIGLVFLASYIFLGTIQSAAQMMQTMDLDGCEKRLALTLKPEWLYVTNRAYYYLIRGSVDMQREKSNEAEQWFNKALSLKLPSDNERAMILIQMINIHIQKNRWTQATNTYRELKKLNYSKELFKEQIKMIDQVMTQQGKVKTMGQMDQRMMFRPGGKRRMPRMR